MNEQKYFKNSVYWFKLKSGKKVNSDKKQYPLFMHGDRMGYAEVIPTKGRAIFDVVFALEGVFDIMNFSYEAEYISNELSSFCILKF